MPTVVPITAAEQWSAGDSNGAMWPSYSAKPVYNMAQGGNGFIRQKVGTIETYTLSRLGSNRPRWMFVTGGVNDAMFGDYPTSQVTDAMEHFERTMNDLGIKVVWVTEPTWWSAFFLEQVPLNNWMLTRRYSVDCAPVAVALGSWDGVHPMPNGAKAYAKCIEENFPQAWEAPIAPTTTSTPTSTTAP